MPSFDIASTVDLAEVDNALANLMREIDQRYDFKGSQSKIDRSDYALTIHADDDLKLNQIHELLKGHLQRRNIAPGVLDFGKVEKAAGQSVRQVVTLRNGIDQTLAKTLLFGNLIEIGHMPKFACLLGESRNKVRMAMPQRVDGNAAGEIQISLTARRHQPATLTLFKGKRRACEGFIKRRTTHFRSPNSPA